MIHFHRPDGQTVTVDHDPARGWLAIPHGPRRTCAFDRIADLADWLERHGYRYVPGSRAAGMPPYPPTCSLGLLYCPAEGHGSAPPPGTAA